MRRRALFLPFVLATVAACEPVPRGDGGERVGRTSQAFDSNEAVLVDFEFDGAIRADTDDPAALRTLIGAQLMYTVGALNAERSVGRHERLELSAIARTATGDVTYHARLPVAWGRPSAAPSSYRLFLPARAAESDQSAFAAKYGETCVDPEAGEAPVHPARMFLFYRPQKPGCVLGTDDVVTIDAKVTPSKDNTTGKYPEYDRVWDDGALRVVALFSRADDIDVTGTDDMGVHAFYEFLTKATAHAKAVGATALTSGGGNDGWSLTATLADGRKMIVDARLVSHDLAKDGATLDGWYDARTKEADLIVYSGHAGLGWNVRTLMNKGSFRAGKYVMWSVNGCDTFAYVDRTLAQRRAVLNPDDPSGTKYMDVVSNVMAGFFDTGAETTVTLIDALVGPPKTYRDIFKSIDPGQVIAVTGEEDNTFRPSASSTEPYPKTALPPLPNDDPPAGSEPSPSASSEDRRASGCSTAPQPARDGGASFVFAALGLLVGSRLVRRSRRLSKPAQC